MVGLLASTFAGTDLRASRFVCSDFQVNVDAARGCPFKINRLRGVGCVVFCRADHHLEGDFLAHSLRSGFVTEAGRQNVPLGGAAGHGVDRSSRRADRDAVAAQLLGSPRAQPPEEEALPERFG